MKISALFKNSINLIRTSKGCLLGEVNRSTKWEVADEKVDIYKKFQEDIIFLLREKKENQRREIQGFSAAGVEDGRFSKGYSPY